MKKIVFEFKEHPFAALFIGITSILLALCNWFFQGYTSAMGAQGIKIFAVRYMFSFDGVNGPNPIAMITGYAFNCFESIILMQFSYPMQTVVNKILRVKGVELNNEVEAVKGKIILIFLCIVYSFDIVTTFIGLLSAGFTWYAALLVAVFQVFLFEVLFSGGLWAIAGYLASNKNQGVKQTRLSRNQASMVQMQEEESEEGVMAN